MTLRPTQMNSGRKGQSIVEYLIMLAVVIVVLLAFFRPTNEEEGWDWGFFPLSLSNVIQQQGYDMLNAARTIF